MSGSILFDAWARPTYYYDPEIGDYVDGNPPDGSTELIGSCAKCCDPCLPLMDSGTVTLAFSGVTICGCFTIGAGTGTIKSAQQSVSISGGTLTGPFGGAWTGAYTLTEVGVVTHSRYTSLACVGLFPGDPTTHSLTYYLTCVGGVISITVSAPAFGIIYFSATGTLTDALSIGLNNSLTACVGTGYGGYGGSVTMSI